MKRFPGKMSKSSARASAFFLFLAVLAALICLPPLGGSPALAEEVRVGRLPAGWAERPPHDESIDRYFIYQERGTILAELLIFAEPLPVSHTPEEYLEALKVNSMPSFFEYEEIEDESVVMHGRDAMIHRFSFSNQQDILTGEMYVFVLDDTGYVFLFDSTESWFPKLQPKFLSFVENVLQFPGAPKVQPKPPVKPEPKPPVKPEPEKPAEPEPLKKDFEDPLKSAGPEEEEPDEEEFEDPIDALFKASTPSKKPEELVKPAEPEPEKPAEPEAVKPAEPEKAEEPAEPEPEQPAEPTPPAGELPAFTPEPESALPELGDVMEPAFLQSENEILLIELPEGAVEVERDDERVVLDGPDDSQIVVGLFADGEEVAAKIAEETKGMRRHGETVLECADHAVTVVLYSERMRRGDKEAWAVLKATWEESGALITIRMPSSKYAGAGEWIKEMLCSVELY